MNTRNSVTTLTSESTRLDGVSFRECFPLLPDPVNYWSSHGEPPIVGGGVAETIRASGKRRFKEIRNRAQLIYDELSIRENGNERPATASPRFFGGISFERNLDGGDWATFGAARFRLPRIQVTESGGGVWLTVTAESREAINLIRGTFLEKLEDNEQNSRTLPRHIERISQYPERQQWLKHVHEILRLIRKGPLEKLVLAQQMNVRFDRPLDTVFLLSALDSAPRNTHRFLFENDDGQKFLGASPETLISRRGDTVETESLAGTIETGETNEENRDLARQLADNPKNQKEHDVVLDTIRQRLRTHVETVNIGDQTVRQFPTVQHLYTPIRGTLSESTHVLTLADTLHPTPAVGGTPEGEFETHRRQFEPFERGWYASPVGWFDREGNGDFAVAIRSALVEDRSATLFAGAGMVDDSQPEKEWDEVQWKYQSLLDVLQQ
jgi:menaquinone-specific isochorismate synthase